MNKANDISNLLVKFGGGKGHYLEVENTTEYKEDIPAKKVISTALAPEKKVNKTPAPVAITEKVLSETKPAVQMNEVEVHKERVEPVMNNELANTSEINVITPIPEEPYSSATALLQSLVRDAALKREAKSRKEENPAFEKPQIAAKVVAVLSANGGVGKTTICAALADVLNHQRQAVAIDLDKQNALRYYLNVNDDEVWSEAHSSKESNWQTLLRHGKNGIQMLPYSAVTKEGSQELSACIEKDANWLARQLASLHLNTEDIVLFDTSSGQDAYLKQVLDVADHVVVVIKPDAGSFFEIDQIERLLKGYNNYSYIMNQFDVSRTFCQDMLEVFKRRVGAKLIGVVSLDHAIDEGLVYGGNPLMEDSNQVVRKEIRAIGEILSSILQGEHVA